VPRLLPCCDLLFFVGIYQKYLYVLLAVSLYIGRQSKTNYVWNSIYLIFICRLFTIADLKILGM